MAEAEQSMQTSADKSLPQKPADIGKTVNEGQLDAHNNTELSGQEVVLEEDIQRENSIPIAQLHFNTESVLRRRDQIAQEPDSKKRAAMIRGFCIQTDGVLIEEENPQFGVDAKVHLAGIDHETATEWEPPRPMDDIFDEYFEEVGNLLALGNNRESASVLFEAICLGHPFINGNGRTGRLLFLYLLNPQITSSPEFIEKYIMDDDLQRESRTICKDLLGEALATIKKSTNIQELPFISIGGQIGSVGPTSEILRLAYKQLHPVDPSVVVNLDALSQKEQGEIRNRVNELGRNALREVLHSSNARERTFAGLWSQQQK